MVLQIPVLIGFTPFLSLKPGDVLFGINGAIFYFGSYVIIAGVFLVFLWYFYRTAKILFAHDLINTPPLTLVILQVILTLFMIIPGFILPVRLWLKARHLPRTDAAETAHKEAIEQKPLKKIKVIIGGLLFPASIFAELYLLTVGLFSVIYSYDLSKDIGIPIFYLIANLFCIGLGIAGYRMCKRK